MNPLTNVKNIQKLNQRELELGTIGKKSWHDEYKDSAWVFIGGLPYDLTEGDIVCVFSQYGEIVNINLVRDKSTGKSKGYAFLCYEDQRSTILAVDNLNSIKLLGRIIRVDHVSDYKKPKEKGDEDEATLQLRAEGCAPKIPTPQTQTLLPDEPQTIRPPPSAVKAKKTKKDKKKKKKKKKKKMKVTVKVERRSESESSSSSSNESSGDEEDDEDDRKRRRKSPGTMLHPDDMKREKEDRGYDRAVHGHRNISRDREHDRDIKPNLGHSSSRHRSHDRHRDEQTVRARDRISVKNEPSDTGRYRDERSEHRPRDRDHDEDRDRYDHQHRDDRKDLHRGRDEYDRRRR